MTSVCPVTVLGSLIHALVRKGTSGAWIAFPEEGSLSDLSALSRIRGHVYFPFSNVKGGDAVNIQIYPQDVGIFCQE